MLLVLPKITYSRRIVRKVLNFDFLTINQPEMKEKREIEGIKINLF